jgi:hypothetical protein
LPPLKTKVWEEIAEEIAKRKREEIAGEKIYKLIKKLYNYIYILNI